MADTFELSDLPLPEASDIPALLAVCSDIVPLRFQDDELLIHGGDDSRDIFLLVKGCCLVEQPDASEERRPGSEMAVLQATPDAPIFVGEMAYLGRTPRTALVRSSMSTWALRLQPEHLDVIMQDFPGLTAVLCRQFAKRLQESNQQLHRHQQQMALTRTQVVLNPGDTLVEAGAPAVKLFHLVDGTLLDGDTPITAAPGRPCLVDAAAFFQGAPHPRTLRAQGTVILLAYPEAEKEKIIRNFPGALIELLG